MSTFNRVTLENLHDPKRFEFQIDKMFNKMKNEKGIGSLFDTTQEGIPFFTFSYDRKELARTIAASIKNETFRLTPLRQKKIKVKNKNKERLVYHVTPLDKIVLCVLARLLTEILEPFLNDCVYSYRKGVSPRDEVMALGAFIKKQRKGDPKKGVYLLQSDIASYSDEINVQETSPFWEQLESQFSKLNIFPTEYQWYLIKEAIRPAHYNLDGALQMNLKGAPTGSPITTLLYNFYVTPVDFYHMYEPTLFYARYSDDIIICHPVRDILESSEDYLHIYLNAVSLTLSPKKTRRYYLSPAGNQTPGSKWQGLNQLDLLGYSLTATGDFCISSARQTKFIKKIRYIIRNTLKVIPDASPEERGRTLCKVLNSVLTEKAMTNSTLLGLKHSSDLSQLKRLDYLIAKMIAESLSIQKGVRAFREIPYKMIREDWGLISLTKERTAVAETELVNS